MEWLSLSFVIWFYYFFFNLSQLRTACHLSLYKNHYQTHASRKLRMRKAQSAFDLGWGKDSFNEVKIPPSVSEKVEAMVKRSTRGSGLGNLKGKRFEEVIQQIPEYLESRFYGYSGSILLPGPCICCTYSNTGDMIIINCIRFIYLLIL